MHRRRQPLSTCVAWPLVLSATVLAAFVANGVAKAAFPGRNGALSVSYAFDCVGQIARLEPDGHPLRMLTPRACTPPEALFLGPMGRASWSPDGRRLIFDYMVPYVPDTDPLRLR